MKQQRRLIGLGGGVATLLVSGLILGFTSAPPPVAKLLFVSNRSGIVNSTPNGNEIWTMDADGTNPVRLTTNTSAEWEPQWNPGGTKIAFSSNNTPSGDWDVFTMNPNGSGVTNITNPSNDPNNASYDFGSTWSSISNQIAFASNRDGDMEIWVMDEFGGSLLNLTNNSAVEGHPAWSLNGTKIAFFSNRTGNDEIWTMDANGGNLLQITNNTAVDNLPTWSPLGDKIAFTSFRDGNYEVYSMNANGSGLKRLTTNAAEDGEPAWSPDGTKIVFWSNRNGNYEIYTMSANGSSVKRLTNNHPFGDWDPTWKP